MRTQHTPGRLVAAHEVLLLDDSTCEFGDVASLVGCVNAEANARRLASCWNALEDLPQAALDGGWTHAGLEAHALKAEQQARQMQAQRDELLAALKRLLASDPTGSIAQATDDALRAACYDSEADAIVREQAASILQARAAIANVKGGAA